LQKALPQIFERKTQNLCLFALPSLYFVVKLCKMESWKFELIQGGAPKTGFHFLLGNKKIQFGFGRSKTLDGQFWTLVLDDRDLILVDQHMNHTFNSLMQQVDFLHDGELLQLTFRVNDHFLEFVKHFFVCYGRNNRESSELVHAWSRTSSSTLAREKLSPVATETPTVVEGMATPVELSKRVQRLVMGIHDYDFIVGTDAIFITKDSRSGLKVVAKLARLTKHRDSQRNAILLDDDNKMMLMRTSEVPSKPYS